MALFKLFVLLLCVAYVSAHAWLSSPKPRGQLIATPLRDDQEAQPVGYDYGKIGDPFDSGMVCRGNDVAVSADKYISLTAGSQVEFTMDVRAKHPGDCFMYLSFDGDKDNSQKKWFKFWQMHQCADDYNGAHTFTATIPDYLPSGSHVVVRFEWYALHVMNAGTGKVEYYTQCVDAKLNGRNGGSLPQPQVSIPGHLPKLNASNYWDPYNDVDWFYTGPALATLNGQPAPTFAPTNAPTTAPTKAPTAAPTNAPTKAPTAAPTAAPTNAATKAPTAAPTNAATKAPTAAPTVAPTATPTIKPTNPPVVQPTTRPNLGTVKLTTVGTIGSWWFAATISGDKADKLASMQLSDQNNFRVFQDCVNEWANVWTFDPKDKGPLVYPLTMKATLQSGSSLSFVVNSPTTVYVDSGSSFA